MHSAAAETKDSVAESGYSDLESTSSSEVYSERSSSTSALYSLSDGLTESKIIKRISNKESDILKDSDHESRAKPTGKSTVISQKTSANYDVRPKSKVSGTNTLVDSSVRSKTTQTRGKQQANRRALKHSKCDNYCNIFQVKDYWYVS